ncbi:hypothetical protein SAMN05443144_12817 [Fodinibius roseus]|uniref:Uncharacterized protein n=1 Tax=Fodinibius roseus TaxID=1194090 RepID=A0A1M5JRI9_9BACT|nr:hypothetical protein SAMN05443144_12817 [Fodinibius roseus]
MKQIEKGLQKYYKFGQYKNFYKYKVRSSPFTGQIHVTFTNGIQKLFASGRCKEEALKKIFTQIDRLASCKNGRSSHQMTPHN